MRPPGRLLGIDHGRVRLGLAVCDALGLVARPLLVWRRRSREEDFARLRQVIAAEALVGAIIGLPGGDEDGPHPAAAAIRNWAHRFCTACAMPALLWDETLTSADAATLARAERRPPLAPIDDWAACCILQSYLDARRGGLAPPLPDEPGARG